MIFQILASFGRGIALGAKPDISQAVSITQRNIERQAAVKASERAAREKEFEKFAEDMQSFDVSGFHDFYTKPLQLAAAKKKEVMLKLHQEGRYSNKLNDPRFLKADLELKEQLNIAEQGTKEFNEIESFGISNANKLNFNEITTDAFAKGAKTGDYEDLRDIVGNRPVSSQFYDRKELRPLSLSVIFKGIPAVAATTVKEVGDITTTKGGYDREASERLVVDPHFKSSAGQFSLQEDFGGDIAVAKEALHGILEAKVRRINKTLLDEPRKEKVTGANIQQNKVYQTKGGTVTSAQSISLGTGTKRYNLTGKVTVFNEQTGKEIDIQKNGVTLQDFARLPFVSAKIIQPLVGKDKLAEFTYFKAIDSYFITNEEVLDKIPKDKIKYKNVMTGMAKPAEEEWEIGTVGTIPTIILFDNQESFLRKNFPDEHKLFLETIKGGETKDKTFSRAILKAKGWTDAQIDNAVNEGKIKLQ